MREPVSHAIILGSRRVLPGTASRACFRSLAALAGDPRVPRRDVEAGRAVPRDLLLSLNRETRAADAACGTVHL